MYILKDFDYFLERKIKVIYYIVSRDDYIFLFVVM